ALGPEPPLNSHRFGRRGRSSRALVESPAGGSLADAEYRLATAPERFTAAAGAYQIDVASATLAPMSLTSTEVAGATSLVPPSISALGTAHLDANGALAGSAQIYHLAAPSDGPATL